MQIEADIIQRLLYDIPVVPPETGGILGGDRGVIRKVFFDDGLSNHKDRAIYMPDINKLNHVIQKWSKCDIAFMGMFHSHLRGNNALSKDDLKYIKAIMRINAGEVDFLFFPIVIPKQNIYFYRVQKDMRIIIEEIDVI